MNKNVENRTVGSDKSYWHKFDDFYAREIFHKEYNSIAEIGIFQGESIRWLMDKFPQAQIYGADILPFQDYWPTSELIRYFEFDQSDEKKLQDFFTLSSPDLIIEDGSHIPEHQSLALINGMKFLKPGGTYCLEDLHTSVQKKSLFSKKYLNSLEALLIIEHHKSIGEAPDWEQIIAMYRGTHFETHQLNSLHCQIDCVKIFKRQVFPDLCWKCKSTRFNYEKRKCCCGEQLMKTADSMTAVIKKLSS